MKLGQRVRIKNCTPGEFYGGLRFLPGMIANIWTVNRIIYINDSLKRYLLDNGLWYTEEMLEKL